jgi:hypothetical protein
MAQLDQLGEQVQLDGLDYEESHLEQVPWV